MAPPAFRNPFDDSIVHFLNAFVGHSALFDKAMLFVCGNALAQGAVFVSIFWYYWFKPADVATTKRTREHLLSTVAGGLIAIAIARCLALTLPFRIRPRFDPAVHFILPSGVDQGTYWDWSAFPSDHAVMFAALATGLFFISRRVGLIAVLYVVAVILFPRLYLGMHYPSDLLVGMVLGVICGTCANVPALRERASNWALRIEHASPGAFYVAMFIAMFLFATMFDSLRQTAQAAWHLIVPLTGHDGSSVAAIIGK